MPHAGIILLALHASGSFRPLALFGCYSPKKSLTFIDNRMSLLDFNSLCLHFIILITDLHPA